MLFAKICGSIVKFLQYKKRKTKVGLQHFPPLNRNYKTYELMQQILTLGKMYAPMKPA